METEYITEGLCDCGTDRFDCIKSCTPESTSRCAGRHYRKEEQIVSETIRTLTTQITIGTARPTFTVERTDIYGFSEDGPFDYFYEATDYIAGLLRDAEDSPYIDVRIRRKTTGTREARLSMDGLPYGPRRPVLLPYRQYPANPNKINFIKMLREITGLGLKEAKDLAELEKILIGPALSPAVAAAIAELVRKNGFEAYVMEQPLPDEDPTWTTFDLTL